MTSEHCKERGAHLKRRETRITNEGPNQIEVKTEQIKPGGTKREKTKKKKNRINV